MQTLRHHHKHDSSNFIQTLWGFALVVMVVFGICGTIYKLLAPSGWIAALMGRGFSGGVAAIGLMVVFGVIGWIARSWTTTREQAATATLVVYVFAAAGVLYSFQLWSKGAF
jgi:predicted phage tail protein